MLTGLNETFSSSAQQKTSSSTTRWINAAALVTFCVYAFVMLALHAHSPMELYDESRNANNAIEMAHNGHWLVTYYDGSPDHWNTKPPLLIWIIAGLMKLGVPAITALRVPSLVAALCTVIAVYLFCRVLIRDANAAVWSGLLLMSSMTVFGAHMAMDGDFDALLCLFTTVYCLAFCVYVEDFEGRARTGLAVTATALVLAILTKGVAGALPLPGLLVYVLVRKRLFFVLRDRSFWLALMAVAVVIAGYYKGRDLVDPGYLKAVWQNELTGRYMTVNEGHHRKALFYARVLVDQFLCGVVLLPLGCLFLLRPRNRDGRAYSAAILCAAVSLVLLIVVSKSQTKIWYYCSSAIPLLAVFGGVGAAEFPATLRRFTRGASRFPQQAWAVGVTFFLIAGCGWALYKDEGLKTLGLDAQQRSIIPQDQYGSVLTAMQRADIRGRVLLIDDGVRTTANFPHYNPIGAFYAKLAVADGGMQVVLRSPEDQVAANTWVTTCDPTSAEWLAREHPLTDAHKVGACVYGETTR